MAECSSCLPVVLQLRAGLSFEEDMSRNGYSGSRLAKGRVGRFSGFPNHANKVR